MARPDADRAFGASPATESVPRSGPSRRVTLPLEPEIVARGPGEASGSIEDLIAALGPTNLRVVERVPHMRPLGKSWFEPTGAMLTLYYGTGPAKAGDVAAGDTHGIGAGPDGYFGAGVYLTGDTYTALRVSESACEREGLFGFDACHQPPVPINLFALRASVGRVCELQAEAGVLRQWTWAQSGIYEPEAVLKLIPAFLAAHGYDTAVLRDEAGPGQDYWLIPDRDRLTLTEHTVLLPVRNLLGQRHQTPGHPIRLETVLAHVPLAPEAFDGPVLSAERLGRLAQWHGDRASVSPREAVRLETEQRQEVRRWLHGKLPGSPAAFSRACLMVEGLFVEASQRTGMAPIRWQSLYQRTQATGEWDTEIVSRVTELLLLKPTAYGSISETLYWAVRQYVRRSGW
ncbi:MAG: hypothetical protein H7338_24715 [Candidatus Sericytochromatia bacterium]|nr:hypothetical protein [Candidatus Sericytochromatia bacterium]